MSPIKDLNVILKTLNEEGTFSEGDTISGKITFNLKSETKVKSIAVKATGDANVRWTEGSGDHKKTYYAQRRYFKLKEFVIEKKSEGTVLSAGSYTFEFTLEIPHGEMPSSFKGRHGKVIYQVQAKISRNWRWPSEETKDIQFVSSSFPSIGSAMCPQSASVSKELGSFSHGEVKMSASVNRGVCSPGDSLSAFAKVCNSSSKSVKPKFSLHQKTVYWASTKTKTSDETLVKMVGETIDANSEVTVSCEVKIPDDVIYSVLNCEIISVEYYIKVYLDISFSFDPEVLFPLIIVPSRIVAAQLSEGTGPHPTWPVGAQSNSDFPPPFFPPPSSVPPPVFPHPANPPPTLPPSTFPPPAYHPHANPPPILPPSTIPPPVNPPPTLPPSTFPPPAYPPYANPPPILPPSTVPPPADPLPILPPSTFPPPAFPPPTNPVGPYPVHTGSQPFQYPGPPPTLDIASGVQNQRPQTPPSTGFITPSTSSAQHPTPTAPPLFQSDEDPPSYTSLFLSSFDPLGRSDQKS